MSRMRSTACLASSVVSLAACAPSAEQADTPLTAAQAAAIFETVCLEGSTCATPPVASNTRPGQGVPDPQRAGFLFAETCILTAPGFEHVPTVLADYPFTQNANTGTYYQDALNFSVKHLPEGCSLVFGAAKPMDDTIAGMAQGTASVVAAPDLHSTISITSHEGPNGLRYVRMFLPSG